MATPDTEIVLVTEYFHPETASTGQLLTDLATGLADRGLTVTAYTSQPNYHSGANERQPRVSNYRGVTVRRIRAPQLRQRSLVRRLFNWSVFTVWMFCRLLLTRSSDREVVFVSNPPFLPPAMWLLCRLKGWDYTYIVYDLYPEVIVASGHIRDGGVVHWFWSWLTARVLRQARRVVALGPVMRDRIVESVGNGYRGENVRVVHNWADGERLQPLAKSENWFSEEHDLVDDFALVYSGNIGANHDLRTLVEAAPSLDEGSVTVLIIGEGDEKRSVVELAERLGVAGNTVEFLPYQDLEDLPYSLTSGDVSVVAVDEGMTGLCVSSKIYTALAVGQPILLIADEASDEARIVDRHDAGIQVSPGDTTGVVAAINRWLSDPSLVERQGENARAAFEANYTKEQSIDAYHRLLLEGG